MMVWPETSWKYAERNDPLFDKTPKQNIQAHMIFKHTQDWSTSISEPVKMFNTRWQLLKTKVISAEKIVSAKQRQLIFRWFNMTMAKITFCDQRGNLLQAWLGMFLWFNFLFFFFFCYLINFSLQLMCQLSKEQFWWFLLVNLWFQWFGQIGLFLCKLLFSC